MPKAPKKQHNVHVRASRSVGLDVNLLLGSEQHLAVEMVQQDGRSVPRISILAYSGGQIRQWWSEDPVVVDLAGMALPENHKRLVLLRDHNMSRPLGNASAIRKTETDLSVDGVVSVPGADADQFVASSRNGFPWRASIGCGRLKVAYVPAGKQLSANGRTFDGPLTHVVSCELSEVSVVTMGADDETESVAASDDQRKEIMNRILATAAGAPPPASPAPAPAVAAGAQTAAEPPVRQPASVSAGVTSADDFLRAQREAEAAEIERVGAIRAIDGITPAVAAQAVRERWTVERTELHVLRANRPQATNVHIPSTPEITTDVIQAAVCQAAGLGGIERQFQVPTLEAAQRAFRGRIGLQQLIVLCAQAGGYRGTPFLRSTSDIREALQAAFSTGQLASVLSAAGNKMLLDAFNHVEQAWRRIAKINANVNDFKEYTTYAYTGDSVFEKVAADGQIKHGTLGDASYTNRLDTYAKMMGLTRQDIINDDLGIIDSWAQKLGRGGGLAFNLAFWTEFLADNSTFFTSARGNYISGSTTTMSSAGLTAALLAFRKLKGADGKVLGATPKFLVVPPDLEVAAEELMTSTNLNSGGASTTEKIANRNVFAGKYEVVPSAYLSDATITGYSALTWWLLADPLDLPLIEAGFLRGAVSPTVEEVAMDPHYLGIEMRGYFDFGVRKQVYQAGVKSKGAA